MEGDLEKGEGFKGINVTPLVDVCLVLVLIFLVTSPFFSKALLPVRLPQAVSSKAEDQENITLSISPDEGFAINEVPINRSDLSRELRKKMKDSGFSFLLIRADERVPYGEVQNVLKIGKALGVRRIAFGTSPKGQ